MLDEPGGATRPARPRSRAHSDRSCREPRARLFLVVLFVLVALAGASFFRHPLAVLLVFWRFLGLVLRAAFGTAQPFRDGLWPLPSP